MLGLATLTFATPLALGALALLPVIWWLLRFNPPRPQAVRFPPFRLLLDLVSREEQPDRTPWWLILLRLTLVTLIILAVARPLLVHDEASGITGDRLLIVIDDGWAAARQWPERERMLGQFIDAAERSRAPVALAVTAPQAQPPAFQFRPAAETRERAAAVAPRALETDRLALLEKLRSELDASPLQVVWLADGLDSDDATAFAEGLQRLAGGRTSLQVIQTPPADLGLVVSPPSLQDGDVHVTVRRPSTSAADTALVRILASNGRSLAERPVRFAAGSDTAEETFTLPLELRNEAARLEIADERTAAGVHLFDDLWRRKTVGLVSGASQELDQPLLSPLYYVSRALEPTSELREPDGGGLRALLDQDLSMLVVADIGIIAREERQRLEGWVDGGGVLVRFAGPRLAGGNDDLVPVELRRGDRTLGSALAWERPQPLAPFPDASPFAGLQLDDTIEVSRQVLAEPTPDLHDKVWASLADGTPLITAARRGNGLLVLVHVTANAEWSNLPLSGLFVEMLNRIVELAPATGQASGDQVSGAAAGASGSGQAWVPRQVLDGFGVLVPSGGDAVPVPARAMDTAEPTPAHPAGLYERAGALRALNLVPTSGFEAMGPLPGGIAVRDYALAAPRDLAGFLFTGALVLLLIDCIAALALAGALTRLSFRRAAAAMLIAGLSGLFALDGARAQAGLSEADRFAMRAALDTRLAYVLTGDRQLDEISLAGLSGLTDFLAQRSSIEAEGPMGIDIERDEIVFFPLIYWPLTPEAEVPSPQTLAKIDDFMKTGGTIFFDTRDADSDLSDITGQVGPATLALRRILENLDIPPLETVPPEHVITKAFYLLQSFPGRWADGRLWVEASQGGLGLEGRADGVSSIIIGSNDYAAAWAMDSNGRALYPVVPGGERQREFAYRTGLNIVMYAMTGNYKADQVHVPALLERLGQ
jgi:hypothetical protein